MLYIKRQKKKKRRQYVEAITFHTNELRREREREGSVPANPLISSQTGNWSDGDRLNGLSPLKQRRKNDLPRYNRLLSSRLSSRVGCAELSCIALRRCAYSCLGRRKRRGRRSRRRKRRCGKSVEKARGGAKKTLERRRRGDGGRERRKERYNLLCCQYVAHNDRLLDFSDTPIIVATDLSRSSLAWITWQW